MKSLRIKKRKNRGVSLVVLLTLGVALVLLAYPAATAATTSSSDPLRSAWERAREAGSYRFTTDVEQRLIPRPLPSMIGQTDQRVDMRIEGEVTLPDYARLQLRFEGGGLDVPPLELIQDGAETYLLKDGEKIPVENPAGLSSPTGDYLSYLAAAENVRECESPSRRVGESAQLACYTYDINGPRFAEYVRDQMQPPLPNVEFSPPPLLQRMSGRGELWVDANGLPRRQVVFLSMPEVNEEYDVQMHMVVDFVFDEKAIQQISKPVSQRIISGITANTAPTDLYCLLLSVAMASVLIAFRRRRWIYGLIAVSVSIMMVVTPLLQTVGIVRFQERQAQAAPAQTIAKALGLPTDSAESPAHVTPPRNTQHPYGTRNMSSGPAPIRQCGDGDPGVDSDNDGLEDVTENCIGTDPYYEDSDQDMITDTLEVNGFEFGGRTWPSDPFKADSNTDGLADFAEWPAPEGDAPHMDGVDNWDPDGDGVPNLWDPDNDGDDVPDNLDLSPFSHTGYTDTFMLTTQGGGFDGHQYIQVQLQPQNQDHLRYTITALDWPYDERGQIQDRDNSTEDLRLLPMLRVITNKVPGTALAAKYGVSAFKDGDDYEMYAPLMPVGDGGRIVAFYAKVVYGPEELDDIRWKDAQLVWTVQASIDHDSTLNDPQLVQTYVGEIFRVTGLQVTKSRDFESAILGTPDFPDDDQRIFNLLFGLSATFLNNQNPDLQTVKERFGNDNTDILETWGVPAQDVAIDLPSTPYGHVDEGMADVSARILRFLDDQNYPTDSIPALVLASEQDVGLYSMDDLGQFQPDVEFNVNLASIEMATQRSLQRSSYEYRGGGWETLTLEETLETVQQRYDDLSGTLETMHADYPELTEHDLEGTLYLFYSIWFVGQTRLIAFDGQALAPASKPDEDVFDQFYQPDSTTVPAYLIEATELAQPGGGLKIGSDQAQTWAYQRDQDELAKTTGVIGESDAFFDFGTGLAESKLNYIANTVRKIVVTISSIITAIQCITWAIKGSYLGFTGWTTVSKAFGWCKFMKFSIRILGVIGTIVAVAIIWVQFGLLCASTDNHLARKQAAAYAVVATVFTVVLFLISLNPIAAIFVAIFALVDIIVFFATKGEFSLSGAIIKGIADFFYEVELLTELKDADFVDFDTVIPEEGLITGSRFQVTDEFVGHIERTSDGDSGDLSDSYVHGGYFGSAVGGVVVRKNSAKDCSNSDKTRTCRNDVITEYQLDTAGRNIKLEADPYVRAGTYYQECTLVGICSRSSVYTNLPEDLSEDDQWKPMTFYLDVLPDSLDGLWSWDAPPEVTDHVFNPDRDGDGLLNSEEVDTDPDNWDSDGDGLSDGFEFESQEELGTNPTNPDSDGDGLSDGFEYRIGTHIDEADSDGDGLDDSEEVYHQAADGQWVGGWEISPPGSTGPIRVFSDPLDANADNDSLDDFSERDNSASPYAYNAAPRLTLDADPLAANPNGTIGAYVEPGDTVVMTLTLESIGPQPVTSDLTFCLPDFMTNVQGGEMRGDRTPPTQSASSCSNGMVWSFTGENTLQLWEVVSATITAVVEPGLNGSVVDEAVATLPYQVNEEPGDITTRLLVAVDLDDPQVSIVAPPDGAMLGGGISSYVIGGSSDDATSWVTHVDVDLPAGAGTVTAEGTGPWAYTWDLPADGVYNLTATAYDYFDRVSPPDTIQVTVDNTPPATTLDLEDGDFVTGQSGDVITVTLTGDTSDNLSGVARVQISTDDRPWREVWTNEGQTVLSANWSADWVLPNEESAQGEHTVAVRSLDRAGNESDVLQRAITVDVVPPTDELTNRIYLGDPPHVSTGQPHALHGVANDVGNVPQPSRPEELVGTLDSIQDATLWLGFSAVDENDAGVNVTWLGDFNGDRLADLAVGLPAADDGAGQITVVYGRAGGWPAPPDSEMLADSLTSFVGLPGAGIGDVMAPAGDVDGDGLNDLAVGDAANNRVYLVFGRPNSLGRDLPLDGPQAATRSELVAPDGEQIGEWLGAAGDVNGDGFDDVLIGVTGAEGKTYLLLGQASPWWETVELDVHAAAEIATDPTGARLTGVGDLDDDQYDEFVVVNGSTVYLFEGRDDLAPRAGEVLSLTEAITTFASADVRPAVVALGDVNGDDLPDFIYADGDAPHIVFGDAGRNWSAQTLDAFYPVPSGFLAAPGDVDADGRNDILLGNADDDAFLILGSDLDAVEATLTGVATAASAPYAAGADLNSDGSSDLLLVPTEAAAASKGLASPLGQTPYINPMWLPHAPGPSPLSTPYSLLHASRPYSILATRYVDDDGCPGCYTTIQAAVTAANPGDEIIIQPGAYVSFTVEGKENLTISGVDPDAVFVDGGGGLYAVHITDTVGVTLANLTLRNAQRGIWLGNAGVGGYQTPEDKITLERLLIHSVDDHAVYMDRVSTISLARCTLVGGDNHIQVYGPSDPAFETDWTTATTDARTATDDGGGLVAGGGLLYLVPGGGSAQVDTYDPDSGTWGALPDAPSDFGPGSAFTTDPDGHPWALRAAWGSFGDRVNAIEVIAGNLYVGGDFDYLAKWDGTQWERDSLSSGFSRITAMAYNGVDLYYADRNCLYRRSVPVGVPAIIGCVNGDGADINAIAFYGDDVYIGGDFTSAGGADANNIAVWDASSDTWSAVGYGPTGHKGLESLGDCYDQHYVNTLLVQGNLLYVGGFFHMARNSGGSIWSSHSLIKYNMSTGNWETADSGIMSYDNSVYPSVCDPDTQVDALALWDGHILVAGNFDHVGGGDGDDPTGSAQNLAFFRTIVPPWPSPPYDDWSIPSWLGANGRVRALETVGSEIYLGGDFTQVGSGTNANHVAHYDSGWQALGSGIGDGDVYALASSGGNLYAGGDFTQAGGGHVGYFSYWDGSQWDTQDFLEYTGSAWQRKAILDTTISVGAALASDGADSLYALVGGGSSGFYRYTISGDTWTQRANLLAGAGAGGALAWADGDLYAFRGDDSQDFYRYDPAANGWETLASLPGIIKSGAGAALAWDGREWVYAVVGDNGKQFLRYHMDTDYWEVLGDGSSATQDDKDVPDAVNAGGGLVRIEDELYVVPGDGVVRMSRYGPVGGYPEKLTLNQIAFVAPETASDAAWLSIENQNPVNLRRMPDDFKLAWENNAWVAGSGTDWSPDPALPRQTTYISPDVPKAISSSGGPTIESILQVREGGTIRDLNVRDLQGTHSWVDQLSFYLQSPADTEVFIMAWQYSCSGDNFDFGFDDESDLHWSQAPCPPTDGRTYQPRSPLSAFDGENSTGTWNLVVKDCCTGYGGSLNNWALEIDSVAVNPLVITHDEANFLAPARDVYRLGASTVLTAGYHIYRPDAIVAPSGEEFTSIQAAIGSGANRVLVRPGVYEEPFYMVSGVDVIGARADQTIVEPAGNATALARAEGIVGASLSRVTLNGDDSGVDGLLVEDGAQSTTFARSIVRGTETGIRVDGEETDLEVVNNTVVENENGFQATSCAPVDVRNTIFAYHGSTGITYNDLCATTQLHTYNDFWANGADLSPAEPGPGEIFLDPLFVSPQAHDYRTLDVSPVIDAGNPTDPSPPGTGNRVDIGYLEQGRASYYAADDYCETCPNDGLTWQVDAFDVIQDALDAAADDLAALDAAGDMPRYTVGVGPGVYVENVAMPSHVRLVGSGAEETTLDGGGDGIPITFDSTVEAEVSEFTITGGSQVGDNILDSDGTAGQYTSLALDSAGNPHISYNYYDDQDYTKHLKYASWTGSDWDIEFVGNTEGGEYTSLAIDEADRPHISYYGGGNLKYAHWTGSDWDIQTVDSAGDAGKHTSLALDGSGWPHISYQSNSNLKYAYWDGSDWISVTVDTVGSGPWDTMGEYTSLALDEEGHAHISYYGYASQNQIKYARWTGTDWHTEIVHVNSPGWHTSLALDGSGNPHIAYGNTNLMYARWTGSEWDIQTADDAGQVGQYPSLALDASGKAHISYLDGSNNDLKYTAWTGSRWQIETLDGGSEWVGRFTSLGLEDGVVHISYMENTNYSIFRLKYYYHPLVEGVNVANASNTITITRNVIQNLATGVSFSGRSTGVANFNTFVNNHGNGLSSSGAGAWASVESNILSGNGIGLNGSSGGQIFGDYNLLHGNTTNYSGTVSGDSDVVDQDPQFQPGTYRLTAASPAVDAASPFAEVPAGGGERADMGYRELLAAPVALFLGQEDVSTAVGNSGVSEVEVGVSHVADPSQPVTETIPGSWSAVVLQTPEETASYWQTTYTPTAEGLHRFYGRATDVVGNQEEDEIVWYEGAFVADDTPPAVDWLSPPNGTSVSGPLELRAQVSDYAVAGEFSVEDIHFEVNTVVTTAHWAAEPWDEESEEPRVFRAWVSLAPGEYDVVAVAEDRAGNEGQSAPIAFTVSSQSSAGSVSVADATSPTLTIHSPTEGSCVTDTVVFSGTASDGGSGLASVEVSVDGGLSWLPAAVDGGEWNLTWETPAGQDFVSYSAWVRASDRAGNVTVEVRVFTIDNLILPGLDPVTFSTPQGTHFDEPTSLTITWNAPVDGGGAATTLLEVDMSSDTTPVQAVAGTSATVQLTDAGDWYVHLAAKDAAGNQFTRHYGPWHVGTFGDDSLPFEQRRQSILIDGYLDLEYHEWLTDTELLDDDERSGETQYLYFTWDGAALYLGWQGAWWMLDGTLWAYLDTEAGVGTNQLVESPELGALPFAADLAIKVASPINGALWTYDGETWQAGPLEFDHGESGDTEVRIPLDTADVSPLQLIALAVDDDGEVWSIFPTTNPLSPPAGGATSAPLAGIWPDAYRWENLAMTNQPNANQPQALCVEMALSSPQASQGVRGPEDYLDYVVDLTNREAEQVNNVQLTFSATTGLGYQTADGAACVSCPPDGDAWLLNVPSLPADATQRVTVTGQLAADISGLSAVTTHVTMEITGTFQQASLSHRVDGLPPTVTVSTAPGKMIQPGAQTIYGTTNDGDGVGVDNVEFLPVGSAIWEAADGTLYWSADVSVPTGAPTWTLQVHATDQYSQTSSPLTVEFTLDTVPPTLTLDLPPILSGNYAQVGGTASDLPTGGQVLTAAVQLDNETASWKPALVYAPNAAGNQNWRWTWNLPSEDGVTHTLRARAADYVGNVSSASEWQETMVDTIASVVTVTVVTTSVGGSNFRPVLTGTVSDGGGVSKVTVHVNTPTGDSYSDEVNYSEGEWSYTPHFQAGGFHTMYVEAWDLAGNVTRRGPFTTWYEMAPVPVGGVTIPVSTFDLLLPWITLVAAVAVVAATLRKRRESNREVTK